MKKQLFIFTALLFLNATGICFAADAPQQVTVFKLNSNIADVKDYVIMETALPIQLGEHSIQITASVGISIAEKRNLPDLDLLKNSDAAMYQAKGSGKNNYRFFDPEELSDI